MSDEQYLFAYVVIAGLFAALFTGKNHPDEEVDGLNVNMACICFALMWPLTLAIFVGLEARRRSR